MREIAAVFWEYVFPENILLVYFFGVLLAIVETPGLKRSFKKGFKLSCGLLISALSGWIITGYISGEQDFIALLIFLLTSLFAIYLLQKMGELEGEWLGLPKMVLVFVPMIGLQWLAREQGINITDSFFMIAGSVTGFYMSFILIAAIKEQIRLAEAKKIFKNEYTLLLAIGFLALAVIGFSFI